jgi:hypothetical protein
MPRRPVPSLPPSDELLRREVAVALLHLARQVLAVAFGNRQVDIGQLAPLLLGATGKLLPLALDAMFVHGLLLLRAAAPPRGRSAFVPLGRAAF